MLGPPQGTLAQGFALELAVVGPKPTLTLLANPLPRGDQRRKGGDVGFRGLGMGEPGHDAFQIDTDRHQNVLEMGFRQADVARPP